MMAAARAHFRAWPRRRADAPVLVRLGRDERRARLINIGLGGACVLIDTPVSVNDNIEVVLHAPNRWDPLVMPARVAWTKGARVGVAFQPTRDADAYDLFEMLGTQAFDT
jgi:hypothetical protein